VPACVCGWGESEEVFTAESRETVSDVIAEVKIGEETPMLEGLEMEA